MRWRFVALAFIVAIGILVRFWGITAKTITHPEFYVPRIAVPTFMTSPPARETFSDVIAGTHKDCHPPGYYALMWLWTGLAGTGKLSIRFPSALAGVLTILALYCLASRHAGLWPALLAAGMLAGHGHHIFWSQHARMYAIIPLLAVLSSLLLSQLSRRWDNVRAVVYVLVTSLGLWTHYYFIPFVAGQAVWIGGRAAGRRTFPVLLQLVLLSVIVASPALGFVWLHSGKANYLRPDWVALLLEIGQFARVLDPRALELGNPNLARVVLPILTLTGVALLLAGLTATSECCGWNHSGADAENGPKCIGPGVRSLAALVPTAFCLAWRDEMGWRLAAVGMTGAWLLVLVWPLMLRAGARVLARTPPLLQLPVVRLLVSDMIVCVTAVPLLLLSVLSLRDPVLAARGLLILTPFVLLVLARGLAKLSSRTAVHAAVVSAVVILFALSVLQYRSIPFSARDYEALANVMRPLIQKDDLIVLRNAWWAEPMVYYLPPDRYHIRLPGQLPLVQAPSLANTVRSRRIWIVAFGDGDGDLLQRRVWAVARLLRGYRKSEQVAAHGGTAILFER